MTIGSDDRKSYQTRVSSFDRQRREDTCLTRAIQNVVDDLATRHDVPSLAVDHDTVKDACDYRPQFGATADPLPEALEDHLSPHGYAMQIDTELDRSTLAEIVEREQCSLPVVELSPSYLHHAEGYDVRGGMHGRAIPHTVVVFTINHDEVQFFDPYEDFYAPPENGGGPPSRLPKSRFYQWWTEETRRWTLWIEPEPQRTLDQTTETRGEE
ncbi:hypothetical protein RYH80_09270 [Halobaculum sp. MBLA0147]|uniref:hypothetical protein n=1 Tax=Halobaculum sp. MBLA0147 TaxID=3079934 RepID=UPI0035250085